MGLIKNKKGIFFTTIVISLILLFATTVTIYSKINERKTIQKRVETLNHFVFSIEKDIPRKLKTTGFRIIFLFEKRIIEKGTYITNLQSTFQEMFFNGTLYGETNSEIQSLMFGATFQGILDDLNNKAKNINANISINNPKISITQEDPWNIKIILESNILIKDLNNLVLWNKNNNITAKIPIENFEDPLYTVNTVGMITNKIKRTPYKNFVNNNNISNLYSHLMNSYYINSTEAPSFLNRLEGINSPNLNGIESLVNLNKLSLQKIPVEDKSLVDHIYFSTSNPSACTTLPSGMPNWFKIDSTHLTTYQISCTV